MSKGPEFKLSSPELEAKLPKNTLINIVPLQMIDQSAINLQIEEGLKQPNFTPWKIPLAQTYMLLRKPDSTLDAGQSPYPYPAITLAGSVVNAGINPLVAALNIMSEEMHAYGIFHTDLKQENPIPNVFSVKKPDGKLHLRQLVYSVPLQPGFLPMTICCSRLTNDKYIPLSTGELRQILDIETIELDGTTYMLPGSLRKLPSDQHSDQVRIEKVGGLKRPVRDQIMEALEKYEKKLRKEVVCEMLYSPEKSNPDSAFQKNRKWLNQWKVDLKSLQELDDSQYEKFCTEYQKILLRAGDDADNAKYKFAEDLKKAICRVRIQQTLEFNRRFTTQGSFLQAAQSLSLTEYTPGLLWELFGDTRAKELGIRGVRPNEPVYIGTGQREIFNGGPELYAKFIRFAFKAFNVATAQDLYKKLQDYRALFLKPDKNQKEHDDLMLMNLDIYEAFLKEFYDKFEIEEPGFQDVGQRLSQWQIIFGRSSILYNKHRIDVAKRSTMTWALEQPQIVHIDQLPEILLGSFDLNPYATSSRLPDELGHAFRIKLLGIAQFMYDVIPHAEKKISENTKHLRDVLEALAEPDTNRDEGYLVLDEETATPKFVPKSEMLNIPKSAKTLKQVIRVTTDIDGQKCKIIFFYRGKSWEEIFRKVIERDHTASQILDISAFTLAIDDGSLPCSDMTQDEKDNYLRNLVYGLERKVESVAKDRLNLQYDELKEWNYRRKDNLKGEKATMGSGASKPLKWLKKYILLNDRYDETPAQTQEIAFFASFADLLKKLKDDERYEDERLASSIEVRKYIDGKVVAYTTVPYWQLIRPYLIPDNLPVYISLMQSTEALREMVARAQKQ